MARAQPQVSAQTRAISHAHVACALARPARRRDLITDLQKAGVIGDPLFNTNWKGATPPWDAGRNWTVSTRFDYPVPPAGTAAHLVFDSIKMGADIYLNGAYLGTSTDQFLRLTYDVTARLNPSGAGNVLNVTLRPTRDSSNSDGRFMGCSGGWDWAP